jgi:DNA replication and repair protein RecF
MSHIKNLAISNFRNFDFFEISASNSAINLIVGPNGSGKTSILEAISLIAPGKGLRNVDFSDIVKYGSDYWYIKSIIETDLGSFNISANHHKKGKNIYLDDARISHVELKKILSIIFLTPQMNYVFSTIVERRKLLDRLVYYFDLEHSSRTHRYEYYLKERMKLLESGFFDQNWMEIIEKKIAEAMIEIATARIKILQLFESVIAKMDTAFPKPIFEIKAYVENNLENQSLVEDIKSILHQNRSGDLSTKRTNFGTHRSDFIIKFEKKDIRAEFCSTGEQKALLTSIILAKTLATIEVFGKTPVILLDEATTHLDATRQDELISFLTDLKCQIWISATEYESFIGYDTNLIELNK